MFAAPMTAPEALALHSATAAGGFFVPPASAMSDRKTSGIFGTLGAAVPVKFAENGHKRLLAAVDPRSASDTRLFCAATRGKAAPGGEMQLDVMTQRSDVRVVLGARPEQALAAVGGSLALLPLLLDPPHAKALAPPPESRYLQQEDGAPYLPLPPAGGLRRV